MKSLPKYLYVATVGDYDDYCIEGAFYSQEAAEKALKKASFPSAHRISVYYGKSGKFVRTYEPS